VTKQSDSNLATRPTMVSRFLLLIRLTSFIAWIKARDSDQRWHIVITIVLCSYMCFARPWWMMFLALFGMVMSYPIDEKPEEVKDEKEGKG